MGRSASAIGTRVRWTECVGIGDHTEGGTAMATLKRGQRLPFPEIPDWFESLPARFAMPTMGELYTVRIEDYMEDGRFVVRAELPGMSPENIDVFISDGVLTVQAERNGMLTVSVGMGAEKPSAKHVEIQHGS